MKKFLVMCLIAFSAMAQQEPKVCKANTTKGEPCKSIIVMKDGYCRAHSPLTPRCGAPTSKGEPCKMMVKEQGLKCKHHKP